LPFARRPTPAAVWFLYIICYSFFPLYFSLELYQIFNGVTANTATYWLTMLLVPLACLLPSFFARQVQHYVWPEDHQIVVEAESRAKARMDPEALAAHKQKKKELREYKRQNTGACVGAAGAGLARAAKGAVCWGAADGRLAGHALACSPPKACAAQRCAAPGVLRPVSQRWLAALQGPGPRAWRPPAQRPADHLPPPAHPAGFVPPYTAAGPNSFYQGGDVCLNPGQGDIGLAGEGGASLQRDSVNSPVLQQLDKGYAKDPQRHRRPAQLGCFPAGWVAGWLALGVCWGGGLLQRRRCGGGRAPVGAFGAARRPPMLLAMLHMAQARGPGGGGAWASCLTSPCWRLRASSAHSALPGPRGWMRVPSNKDSNEQQQ
jgi:hypothetical protein